MHSVKSILEIAYFISGPAVAIIACIALRQITEVRNQVKETRAGRLLSVKRDAYKIAASKCDYYLNVIIPLINDVSRSVRDNNVTFFEKSKVVFLADEMIVTPVFSDENEMDTLYLKLPLLDLFNPLEGFSIFFTSGIADEEVGYLAVGRSYCETVKKYLPFLAICFRGGYYLHIQKLYSIWSVRASVEKLQLEKDKIEKELISSKVITIKTIGDE